MEATKKKFTRNDWKWLGIYCGIGLVVSIGIPLLLKATHFCPLCVLDNLGLKDWLNGLWQ